ncbi:MAG: hypothetical protein HIU88_06970 [Acidobacteria bacterium]|nr:hypothetical protein [Acidobacteriota bacterium]
MMVTTQDRMARKAVSIYYGGRRYVTRLPNAQIFLRQALDVARRHDCELVVLPYEGGVELLLISETMPFSVGSAEPDELDSAAILVAPGVAACVDAPAVTAAESGSPILVNRSDRSPAFPAM